MKKEYVKKAKTMIRKTLPDLNNHKQLSPRFSEPLFISSFHYILHFLNHSYIPAFNQLFKFLQLFLNFF